MEIKEKIENWIKETLKVEAGFAVEHPTDLRNGDYSTNIAMVLAKKENKNPAELANEFGRALSENKIPEVEEIKVAGGFINFYLSKKFFVDSFKELNKEGEKYGKNNLFDGQKIIIEYTDPNPFKQFHIGHLMSNAIGESISRIIEIGGPEIKRLSYGGDVGLHVAKAIFAISHQKEKIEEKKKASEKEQLKFWAVSYMYGNAIYENEKPENWIYDNEEYDFRLLNESEYKEKYREEIDNLNKVILYKSDPEINKLYDWGRELSISHFQEMFRKLDTHFDKNIWESEVVEDALKVVDLGLQKNILEKSEGAVIFRGENYGLHTRVFVNSKGVPTYEAKELGLGIKKYEMFSFDKSIVITGNEQNEYFKVVLKATELIKPEVSGKTVHMGHGMLRFASGKMSSRKGNIITAEYLIEKVKEEIKEKLKDRDYSDEAKEQISEIVAIGAIKYSILRQAIGGDIIFDFDKSISFEGDSGPYLQYTAVRANSVLEKAGNKKSLWEKVFGKGALNTERPENFEITELEKYLYRFPEVVKRAGEEYAPHYVVTYLLELAGAFNSFYAKERIIGDDPSSPYKIKLTQAVYQVLKNGLYLLGIKVPSKM